MNSHSRPFKGKNSHQGNRSQNRDFKHGFEIVKTIKVIRLKKDESATDLTVGRDYHAVFHGPMAVLNDAVSALILNSDEATDSGYKQGAVKVKSVSKNDVKVEYLKGRFELETEAICLADISKDDLDKKFKLRGKVEKIQQTGGPTLFLLFDGSGTMNVKGFAGAGKRAYPEIEEGDVVEAEVAIIEHEEVLEGEISSIAKLNEEQKQLFAKVVEAIVQKRIQPVKRPFLVQSKILDRLQPEFEKAVRIIKRAIVDSRPIVLKHHADCDGYSAALALERAIMPLMREQHSDEKALWKYYARTPSKSPYYDYYDATKDVSMALSDMAKFNDKMPLIVIVDTGSGPENELPIQLVKLFDCEVIVIDHHHFEKDPISNLAAVHINPHFVGSETDFSAGMLCVEISRMISDKSQNVDYIAALAGIADRIESDELNQYLKIAEGQGYSKEYLEKLGAVIDFEAWTFKFSESRELVDFLFGSDSQKQKQLCELLYPKIQSMMNRQLAISKQFVKTEDIGNVKLAFVDIENTSNFGVYPNPGKATGNLHDALQKDFLQKPVLTVGYGKDFITLRATDKTNFSVSEFVQQSINAYSNGGIEGGGHEHAGSLRFIPMVRDQLLEKIRLYMKQKNS
ncbi:MAG: DHH family phosphoesterase [Candidatus Micrarchaeota archaeon]